jgi:hypothetical protein
LTSVWTQKQLNELLREYDHRFFGQRLSDWKAIFSGDHKGLYGFCDAENKVLKIRLEKHRTDQDVCATLIHEMAHADSTDLSHGDEWRKKMVRLKEEGAPTDPLDFLVPYKARLMVTSFIEYAKGGASWDEAVAELWTDLWGVELNDRLLQQCKWFFENARRDQEL